MRPAQGLRSRLRETERAHLAREDQILDGPRDLLDRDAGVDAVLVEEIDPIGAQPTQRGVDDLTNVIGLTVQPATLPGGRIDVERELGGDDDLVAEGRERLADDLLVDERPVGLRGVEECDAPLDGPADESDGLVAVGGLAVVGAQPHAPRPRAETLSVPRLRVGRVIGSAPFSGGGRRG
jgi:hypothetical protein